ncbi:MAG: hypothetical protein L0220_01170, partial [Acidobacteria bacterium]|nr:hypothetical protein [Acidobacteriota bacterium]
MTDHLEKSPTISHIPPVNKPFHFGGKMPEEATPFIRDPARKIPFPVLGETRAFTIQTGLFIRKMFEELMPLPP